MTLAKAYFIIAKEHNNLHLAWELSSKIRSCQLLLSKAAMKEEPITLDEAEPIIKDLSSLIFKAQDAHYDIATAMMTMKSHIQALEGRASAATVQSTVFGQLAAESLPKDLHCLHVKLMTDWLEKKSLQEIADEKRNSPRLVDNNLYHFCIFSDNLVAVSVVINSTVCNAEHPKQLVFHIVTNGVSYGAMQAWFISNDFRGSTIEVQSIEDFTWLNASYSPVKEMTPLFSLDLHGNVNGAVETCLEAFHRKANVTAQYHYWQQQNVDKLLWKLGTLPPGLLAFYGLTESLDRRWHVLGLGFDLNIDNRLIESAAVIHFNGNMKPWLKLALGTYKPLWERYMNQSHPYLQDCVTS
ncbi:galacturonosyltransferase 11 [Actinidia rufa]|uniref:Hexosyltransferase n=1 Tax=Actinidia rufa TaxID=165716 RepID=A0A7J0H1L6_9ERIC|nr:galacturonosyltransferase 11 [Actinidia rufa]